MGALNLSPAVLGPAEAAAIRSGALVTLAPWSVLSVSGPGALSCLQGLLTNDLEAPGDGTLVYGALLTPKGMIVVDAWVLRLAPDRLLVLVEEQGSAATLEIFRRTLPPRLARVAELSHHRVLRLHGSESTLLERAGLPTSGRPVTEGDTLTTAKAHQGAPFQALAVVAEGQLDECLTRLAKAGIPRGTEAQAEATRVVAGWPRLGREIGEKTLPQEVRFDQIGGVSYSKGCYTGQETVARLHFRGHANRELRGLLFDGMNPPVDLTVALDGKAVGEISSLLETGRRTLGLAVIRREVEPGTSVLVGDAPATVISLPFAMDLLG